MQKAKKRGLSLLQMAMTVLLAVLLFCNLSLFLSQKITGNAGATVFGFSLAVVASGSMDPALSVDDLVLIQAKEAYSVGDIITFERDGVLVTHRIAGIQQEDFLTKGDANAVMDQAPVAQEQIVGKVIVVIPYVGKVLSWLRTPLGMTLLVFWGLLLLQWPKLFLKNRRLKKEG